WADGLLQLLNYRSIRRFSRCWVPDMAAGGLAGDLSHPERMPSIPTRYIGWLSRFGGPASGGPDIASAPLLVALLSGPEPQRTLLEKDILRQARAMADKVDACRRVIVRGLPWSSEPVSSNPTASRDPSGGSA